MATVVISKTVVPGVLGDILVDVRASDRRAPAPAVLIVHGFKGFKDWGMLPPFAARLAKAGFTAVSFNLSGSGVDDRGEFTTPERFGRNTFSIELEDIERVRATLDAGGLGVPRPTAVAMVGHSRGGGMTLLTAAHHPEIRSIVTWAAISTVRRWPPTQFPNWRAAGKITVENARTGQLLPLYTDVLDDVEQRAATVLDIDRAAATLDRPWLLIHGTADTSVAIDEAEQLIERGKANPKFESLILPGANHTFGAVHPFAGTTPDLETVFDASVGFLSRTVTG